MRYAASSCRASWRRSAARSSRSASWSGFTENMTRPRLHRPRRGDLRQLAAVRRRGRVLLFGFSSALASRCRRTRLVSALFPALPYILTLIAVAGLIGRSIPPAADGTSLQEAVAGGTGGRGCGVVGLLSVAAVPAAIASRTTATSSCSTRAGRSCRRRARRARVVLARARAGEPSARSAASGARVDARRALRSARSASTSRSRRRSPSASTTCSNRLSRLDPSSTGRARVRDRHQPREARLRQGLDFPEIETGTKIRGKYLRALEDEQFDVLPGQTYVKGFLRTYADYLGLDGQLYVDEFNSRYVARTRADDPRAAHGPARRHRRVQGDVVIAALVGIAVVTALVIVAWTAGSPPKQQSPASRRTRRRSRSRSTSARSAQSPKRRASRCARCARRLAARVRKARRRARSCSRTSSSSRARRSTSPASGSGSTPARPENLRVIVNGKRVTLPGRQAAGVHRHRARHLSPPASRRRRHRQRARPRRPARPQRALPRA